MTTLVRFPEFDHYAVSRILGEGGMGIVFHAEDRRTSLPVAIKVMSRGLQDTELQARFMKEMQILASLNHRNIVRCYEVVRSKEGLPSIVMEYLEGVDLTEFEGRPFPELIPLAIQSAMGLAYLQKLNILHRDLSSNNIIVTLSNGRRLVKIVDFGVAKVLQEGNAGELTQTGEFLGKLAFASPELLILSAADFRSDIYSLGVIFFRLLTKRRPLHVQNSRNYLEWVKAHEKRVPLDFTPPPGNPPLPPPLQAIVTKMLEHDASKRPQGYEEIIDTLVAIQSEAEKAGLMPDPASTGTLPAKSGGGSQPTGAKPSTSARPAEGWVVPSSFEDGVTSAPTSAATPLPGMTGGGVGDGTPEWLAPADRLEEMQEIAGKDRDKYAYRPPHPTGVNRTDNISARRRAEAARLAEEAARKKSGGGGKAAVIVLAVLAVLGGGGYWAWGAFLRDMVIPAPMSTLEPSRPSAPEPVAAAPAPPPQKAAPRPAPAAAPQAGGAPSSAESRGLTTANVAGFLPNPTTSKTSQAGAVILLGFRRPANITGISRVRIVRARDAGGEPVPGLEGAEAQIVPPEDPTGARLLRLLLAGDFVSSDARLQAIQVLDIDIGPGHLSARLEKRLLSN